MRPHLVITLSNCVIPAWCRPPDEALSTPPAVMASLKSWSVDSNTRFLPCGSDSCLLLDLVIFFAGKWTFSFLCCSPWVLVSPPFRACYCCCLVTGGLFLVKSLAPKCGLCRPSLGVAQPIKGHGRTTRTPLLPALCCEGVENAPCHPSREKSTESSLSAADT